MPVTLVSMSAYADLHDVSKQAVGKWKAKGYLAFREGKVWVENSDRALRARLPRPLRLAVARSTG